MNKAQELIDFIEEENKSQKIDEVDSKRLRELLRVVTNLLQVRGVILNKKEQEKIIFMLAKAAA